MNNKPLLLLLLVILVTLLVACNRRMAPFSPHRTQSDVHRAATTNQVCAECHDARTLGREHRVEDNCLRCHRIVQGD